MGIGKHLKKLRKENGLSYRQLAEKVNISHTNISLYEKGEMNPSLDNVISLSKFFNVPIEYFIAGERADFKYHDLGLVKLFAQSDSLPIEYRRMIKKYIKKVIKNAEEKQALIEECEE